MGSTSGAGCGCGGGARGLGGVYGAYADLGAKLGEAVLGSSGLGRQVLEQAARTWRPVLDAWQRALAGTLPLRGRCDVPETDCPPRCVGTLELRARPKEPATATVTVTNTDTVRRAFTFVPQPFRGPSGDTGVVPEVAPLARELGPDESVELEVRVVPDERLAAGVDYEGRIAVRGAYEQCVCVALRVEPRVRAHCEVRQGAVPTHQRAHRWYDHFQCTEPCFEPLGRRDLPPIVAGREP